MTLSAAVGALLAGGAVVAAIALLRRTPDVPPKEPAAEAAAPVVFCPKGTGRVPAATLPMGEPEAKPPYSVQIDAFCMDITEVTAGEYEDCVARGTCPKTSVEAEWLGITKSDREKWSPFCNRGKPGRREHPM